MNVFDNFSLFTHVLFIFSGDLQVMGRGPSLGVAINNSGMFNSLFLVSFYGSGGGGEGSINCLVKVTNKRQLVINPAANLGRGHGTLVYNYYLGQQTFVVNLHLL